MLTPPPSSRIRDFSFVREIFRYLLFKRLENDLLKIFCIFAQNMANIINVCPGSLFIKFQFNLTNGGNFAMYINRKITFNFYIKKFCKTLSLLYSNPVANRLLPKKGK